LIVVWFIEAYATLSKSRDYGNIKLTEVLAYTELFNLIVSKKEFTQIMQALDEKYLEGR